MRRLLGPVLALLVAALPAGAADRESVHRALLEKDAAYRRAVATFDAQGTNAEDFRQVVATAADRALEAHATFFLGRALANRDEFEAASACFEKVVGPLADATPWADEASFHLAYSLARRSDLAPEEQAVARERARALLRRLPETAPERVRESARWLLRELDGEGSSPLLEIALRMDAIRRAIGLEDTGRPTQARQESVIHELDRLIDRMKAKESDGRPPQGSSPGRAPRRPRREPGPVPGAERAPLAPLDPRGPDDGWGELTPKQRQDALQLLRERFPERYRELIEQYSKSIADGKGSRK